VREQVLAMSSATIDRLLAPIRNASGGKDWRRTPRACSGVRRRVPVSTFKGWEHHHGPGWLEIDLVAHCGRRMQGPFLWTLMATDIATGWSEIKPNLVRDGAALLTALQLVRRQLPFPLRGIDADNDPRFMNSLMEAWCACPGHQIVLTRSRAYQSNDQAWVEQKSGMLVRRVVGYQRLEGLEAAQVLGELYGALQLFTNLLQPSFKLKSSKRDDGRIKRQHHPPRTPLKRLIKGGALPQEKAEALQDQQRRRDPGALLGTIRRCQRQLAVLDSGQHGSQEQSAQTARDLAAKKRSLEVFPGGLQSLWHSSQPRRRKPKPRTGKRSRPDAFEPDVVMIEQWLQAEPLIRAKTLMERLIQHNPKRYGESNLRSLQRRLRGYLLQRIEREMDQMLATQPRVQEEAEAEKTAVLPGVNENG
jgi:hypothetical protein